MRWPTERVDRVGFAKSLSGQNAVSVLFICHLSYSFVTFFFLFFIAYYIPSISSNSSNYSTYPDDRRIDLDVS